VLHSEATVGRVEKDENRAKANTCGKDEKGRKGRKKGGLAELGWQRRRQGFRRRRDVGATSGPAVVCAVGGWRRVAAKGRKYQQLLAFLRVFGV